MDGENLGGKPDGLRGTASMVLLAPKQTRRDSRAEGRGEETALPPPPGRKTVRAVTGGLNVRLASTVSIATDSVQYSRV